MCPQLWGRTQCRVLKTLDIRQMRGNIGRLDELVVEEGEWVISRRGQPIAGISPVSAHRQIPDHADWRLRMARLQAPPRRNWFVRNETGAECEID